jgi:regulation of enolase protein 1 (concanavalin A-like superfamily)
MSSKSQVALALLLAAFLAFTTFSCAFATTGYNDEFNTSPLNSFWTTAGSSGATYDLTTHSGSMIITSPSSCDLGGSNDNAPRILQPVTGDFEATTKISGTFTAAGVHAGLLIYQDSTHFVRVEVRDVNKVQIGGKLGDNTFVATQASLGAAVNPIYLKLEKETAGASSTIEGYWSSDGITWNLFGSYALTLSTFKIGLFVINQNASPATFSADFDYFHITPGNIFDLPEYSIGIIAVPLAMIGGFLAFRSRQKIKSVF